MRDVAMQRIVTDIHTKMFHLHNKMFFLNCETAAGASSATLLDSNTLNIFYIQKHCATHQRDQFEASFITCHCIAHIQTCTQTLQLIFDRWDSEFWLFQGVSPGTISGVFYTPHTLIQCVILTGSETVVKL